MKLALTYDDVSIVPKLSNIEHRRDIDLSVNMAENLKMNVPIFSSPMDTITEIEMAYAMAEKGGIGIIHRFMNKDKQWAKLEELKILSGHQVGAALGVTGNYLERATVLANTGVDLFVIDVAHGHHTLVKQAVRNLKNEFKNEIAIMAGNIATNDSAKYLIDAGADILRVGIGSGSLCSTRVQTGVGLPMVTSLIDISNSIRDTSVTIIADGGVRKPGDVAKALAAGAHGVMLGSLLSGTKETPGVITKTGQWPNEQLQKKYRGSASLESKLDRNEINNIEGYSTVVPYKGKVKRIITDIKDGVRSAFSYVGARNLQEFHEKSEFVRVTNAGLVEASPHLL